MRDATFQERFADWVETEREQLGPVQYRTLKFISQRPRMVARIESAVTFEFGDWKDIDWAKVIELVLALLKIWGVL